jgi:hypothetical protein
LYNREPIDILESEFSDDSDTDVDMSSGSEQRESSDNEYNANDNSDMQHNTWTRSDAERPHFPFSGKPGISVDLEVRNNPLEYFELFITPEIAELISREASWYAHQFL